MTDLLAARSQMAMSLAFHIIFACAGIAMPLLMVLAEGRYRRTGDRDYLEMAKRWSKGVAILFAVGAVSGTMLSFELGLLWPGFMELAGPIIGMPFSLEGFAFFLEAIFLGIYLYGWDRVSPRAHLFAGWAVVVSGALSGAFVVCANAWMNTPAGFEMVGGEVTAIYPLRAMFNPAAATQMLHMTLAAFAALGMAVAGVHAAMLLRRPDSVFHRKALWLALTVGGVASLLQPLSGDLSAKHVAHYQPAKFAAMEAHWETETHAALTIGGWPNEELEETRWAIKIPMLLSVLAHMNPAAEVTGLSDIPEDERPPVAIVHVAFQIMVACGMLMIALAAFAAWWHRRRRGQPLPRRYLQALVIAAPAGFIAVEAGWTVTEVGRQPWVIHGIMRTADAVTPMPGLQVPFLAFSFVYLVLGIIVVKLLRYHVFKTADHDPDALAAAASDPAVAGAASEETGV